jgi:cell division protein ZipA
MSPLQWALLIFGVLAVVAVYLYSRRDRRAMHLRSSDDSGESLVPKPRDRQLDIFNGENQQFDEYGVGKPRRVAPSLEPMSGEPGEHDAEAEAEEKSKALANEKIVSLLIAEREGTHIKGALIHKALAAQRLEYGDHQIYHRVHRGKTVFGVASLLKPGFLDPAAAASFSTPGLTLFMVLPGPLKATDALKDMLDTAGRLASALNAEVYDAKRQLFTPEAARGLKTEVEAWARNNAV